MYTVTNKTCSYYTEAHVYNNIYKPQNLKEGLMYFPDTRMHHYGGYLVPCDTNYKQATYPHGIPNTKPLFKNSIPDGDTPDIFFRIPRETIASVVHNSYSLAAFS